MCKKIYVGTTGDYPPFTFLNAENQFAGQDIDLFKAFAKAKGYEIEWIKTSWPTLSQDLQAGLFSVALGGISFTEERARLFFMSNPLRADAKVILCHRDFAPYFAQKETQTYDRPEFTFIYNPGGTNEAIAKASLHRAKLNLEPDMENIFKRLEKKEVTAFITDVHEALYRAKLSGGTLMALNIDQPLSKTDMIFMFHPDAKALGEAFNQWFLING